MNEELDHDSQERHIILTNTRLPSPPNTGKTMCIQSSSEGVVLCGVEVPGKQVSFELFQIVHFEGGPVVLPRHNVLLPLLFAEFERIVYSLRER